jgi:hypothetical protein
VLTFRSSPDYETKSTYMVTVEATDGTNTATRNVTVRVTTDAVVPVTDGTLLARYAGTDGVLELDDVFMAIDDYFDYDDRITLEEIYELVDLYFES